MKTPDNRHIPKLQFSPRRRRRWLLRGVAGRGGTLAVGMLAGIVAAGGGFALAATTGKTIHGCVSKKTDALTIHGKCAKGSTALSWAVTGPRGATGAQGPAGPQGVAGTTTTFTKSTTTTQAAWATPVPWSASTDYTSAAPASVVTYDGSTYVATADNSDSPPDISSSDWTEVAAAGADGTAVAWAQINPDASGPQLQNSSIEVQNGNVVDFWRTGAGIYQVLISGCDAADPQDASASVTPLLGSADDEVNYFTADIDQILNDAPDNPGDVLVSFYMYDITLAQPADDDFSIEVNC